MRKRILIAAMAAVVLVGCSEKHLQPAEVETNVQDMDVELTVNVPVSVTKVSSASDESKINGLQVLVFDSNGVLEAFKTGTGSSLTLTCTSGEKTIAVFANAESMAAVNRYSELDQKVSDLSENEVGGLVMEGYKEVELSSSGTVNIALKRLAAKVTIKSIKNSFELAQHQQMEFKLVSVYLVNVAGGQYFNTAVDTSVPTLWYHKGSCTSELPFLYDVLSAENVLAYGDTYAAEHYFYCYPNPVSSDVTGGEQWSERLTRLVVEATLDGETYYYPITIDNIAQNSSYAYTLEITRPGSSSPDIPVDDSAVNFNVTVSDWIELPVVPEVI